MTDFSLRRLFWIFYIAANTFLVLFIVVIAAK